MQKEVRRSRDPRQKEVQGYLRKLGDVRRSPLGVKEGEGKKSGGGGRELCVKRIQSLFYLHSVLTILCTVHPCG